MMLLLSVKERPRLVWSALQIALLPVPLRVNTEESVSVKFKSIRPTKPAPHRHCLGSFSRCHLPIDRASWIIGHVPNRVRVTHVGLRVGVVMRTYRPRGRLDTHQIHIERVAKDFFASLGIDFP